MNARQRLGQWGSNESPRVGWYRIDRVMRIEDAGRCTKIFAARRRVRRAGLALLVSSIAACTAQTAAECPASLVVASPTARSCVPPSNPTRASLVSWMDCVLTAIRVREPLETGSITTRISNGRYLSYVILNFEGGARNAVGPCPRLVARLDRPGHIGFACGTPEYNPAGTVVPFPTRDEVALASTADLEAALFSGRGITVDSPEALGPFTDDTCVTRQRDVSTQPSACGLLVASTGDQLAPDAAAMCGDAAAE